MFYGMMSSARLCGVTVSMETDLECTLRPTLWSCRMRVPSMDMDREVFEIPDQPPPVSVECMSQRERAPLWSRIQALLY